VIQEPETLDLEGQLESLERMNLVGLRSFWRERWGREPGFRSATLLRQVIGWRLQTARFGGIDAETQKVLQRKSTSHPRPPAGARLTREYRGVLHTVEVGRVNFTYAGRVYPNLSRIAEAITGTHWNGPAFFGLRRVDGS
jgi:hypothetical protein